MLSDSANQTEKSFESSFYSDIAALNMLATATKGFEKLQELTREMQVINRGTKSLSNMGLFNSNIIVNQ